MAGNPTYLIEAEDPDSGLSRMFSAPSLAAAQQASDAWIRRGRQG